MKVDVYDNIHGRVPESLADRIHRIFQQSFSNTSEIHIFFRADDIGVPSHSFSRMMDLFLKFQIPLNLAVVPAWITCERWKTFQRLNNQGGELFLWHQHGWRHVNHETFGKKQEFGPARSNRLIYQDLEKGKQRLEMLLGKQFFPFFTPPWNRCSEATFEALVDLDFKGVSLSHGSTVIVPETLFSFPVRVDLHTRKESRIEQGWGALIKELELGMEAGFCGFMIHHGRMSNAAFIFLEFLLEQIVQYKNVYCRTFDELG